MDRCAVGGVRDPLVAGLEPSADCPSAATQYVEVRKQINNIMEFCKQKNIECK